jgi:hypothetical protein
MFELTHCSEPDCRICKDELEPEEQLCLTNHSFDDEGYLKPYYEYED